MKTPAQMRKEAREELNKIYPCSHQYIVTEWQDKTREIWHEYARKKSGDKVIGKKATQLTCSLCLEKKNDL